MKITNRLKKKLLVLDGIDNDFIEYGKEKSAYARILFRS